MVAPWPLHPTEHKKEAGTPVDGCNPQRSLHLSTLELSHGAGTSRTEALRSPIASSLPLSSVIFWITSSLDLKAVGGYASNIVCTGVLFSDDDVCIGLRNNTGRDVHVGNAILKTGIFCTFAHSADIQHAALPPRLCDWTYNSDKLVGERVFRVEGSPTPMCQKSARETVIIVIWLL